MLRITYNYCKSTIICMREIFARIVIESSSRIFLVLNQSLSFVLITILVLIRPCRENVLLQISSSRVLREIKLSRLTIGFRCYFSVNCSYPVLNLYFKSHFLFPIWRECYWPLWILKISSIYNVHNKYMQMLAGI